MNGAARDAVGTPMKVELHLHTSRYSGCAIASPEELMARLVRTGYEAVYITEHNTVWPEDELARLRAAFPTIRIFSGLELTLHLPVNHDLLILGTNDPGYLGCTESVEAIKRARAEGCLTVLAHPFRWEDPGELLKGRLLPDALEYQTNNHDSISAGQAKLVAEGLHLPIVNAGDVHALRFVNRFWIETDRPVDDPHDIRGIVIENQYRNRREADGET